MGFFSGRLDDFEQACRDGNRVGWFGSVELPGGGEVTVHKGGVWWNGELREVQARLVSRELEPQHGWFGSRVLEPPGD